MSDNGRRSAREQALAELQASERFCLVTHENPDGDALGSLVGMHRVLAALGKDSVMLMCPQEFPLPYEYRFFDLDGLVTEVPADQADAQLASVLGSLPKVDGAWGSGRVFEGTAFSAVLTDDGRLAVGAVGPELLYDALAK